LSPAPFSRYLAALFYDALLVCGLLLIASFIYFIPSLISVDSSKAENLSTTAFGGPLYKTYLFFIWFGFFARFWTHGGQTLGMAAWRIKIQCHDGSAINLWQALLRFFSALAPWVIVLFIYYLLNKNQWLAEEYRIWVILFGFSGIIWSFFDRENLMLHDHFSETRLVCSQPKS